MLKSHVRSQPSSKSKRNRVKATIAKHKTKLIVFSLCSLSWLTWHNYQQDTASLKGSTTESSVATWRSLTPSARMSQLEPIAAVETSHNLSFQQQRQIHRARYLLAADLIQQKRGKEALNYLEGLADDYSLLRPQILFQIARAYGQTRQEKAARQTLKDLITTYPQHPLAANALALLEENREENQARILEEFPYHPIARELARQYLRQDVDRFELLMLLAKYERGKKLNSIRDRLVLEYPAQLDLEDWETIADGYWRAEEHRKAADAYTLASPTPRNLYRAARGFHRNGNIDSARSAYQRLLREYHDAREAGQALIQLASISSGDEAVVYLEKAISKFPEVAPDAYLAKAIVHQRFDKQQAAKESRQKLLNRYGDSAAAAQYRWQTARQLAAEGNYADAVALMQPVIKSQREFDFAAEALYWTGKWATGINDTKTAKAAFTQTIALYPQTYWAWRSAVKLSWNVGDFEQLRSRSPVLDLKETYNPLPMGSPALQELYLLGQYRDAWLLLQSEIGQPQQLTVAEQFTEGVLQLKLGRYSEGMQEIWELTQREDPREIEQWQVLRQTKTYWHSLFPFPYQTQILEHARTEKIDPLLVISVMRKESTFDPDIDSAVGAVGLMQIVPPTARWVAQQIDLADYSLTKPEDNIKIGSWYLNYNHRRYDDNSLLAVASYNAGTSNVNTWLTRYDLSDRDRFVEQIPFPETKDYVEGVFGNYWNYLRLYNPEIREKIENLQNKSQ